MNKLSLLLLFLFGTLFLVQAQQKSDTVAVSDAYYAKVFLENDDEITTSGWIGIYSKKTNKELIKVNSDEFYIDRDEKGNISVNVLEMPYGSQSAIIYDDFNFDGIKDFAIRDGNMSCYGGPSYQVFLADGKGGFSYNQNFTDLAQDYCGMFDVDHKQKRIRTMTKSGCCQHWFYTFDVVDNKPRMRQEIEEIMSNRIPFIFNNKITNWDAKGKKTEKKEDLLYLEQGGNDVLFSFKLKNKDRTVMIINGGEVLYYVFVKQNADGQSVAEFCYPSEYTLDFLDDQLMTYTLSEDMTEETLTFANPSAEYKIYNTKNKVGVRVITNGKEYDMPGDPASRNVTYFFDKLEGVGFDNLNFDAVTRLDFQ